MNSIINKNLVLASGACVFQENRGRLKWFLVKQNGDSDWEIPKVMVRKGESSVRAVLRMMGEKANMTARVLEEIGRFGGTTTVNGKRLPQRQIYYLMVERTESGEAIGFTESTWLDHSKSLRVLSSKRERAILKSANSMISKMKKEGKKFNRKSMQDEEEE